ncbi:MAG: protein-glutamine glutaminase family protein [Caldimonas sp.]
MANPNAVVSSVIQFDGGAVRLGNERQVRLDPERPDTRGLVPVIEGLRRLRQPVYLEIDPATAAITRLLIPYVTHVSALRQIDAGLGVELDNSHAAHVLRRGRPDYEEFERTLREAMRDGRVLLVTDDDAHDIVDVRAFTPGPDGELPPLPPFPEPPPPLSPWPRWLRDLWHWRVWPWWWFRSRCVSSSRAQQIFNAMAATTCNPVAVPPPCIPFMYPDDGCWGRAHEMCRLMVAMGLEPKKVWIDAVGTQLKADTRNNPSCFVQWNWHVAPTLCVRRWYIFFLPWAEQRVIDPSLFTTPVSKAAWKGIQNNPNATLTDTDWTYFRQWGETDPTFTKTDGVLATYRLRLQQRSALPAGPPPYAYCP